MTRWRLSSIDIRVETGRYSNIPRNERRCELCSTGEIEDENHVIFRCSAYQAIRAKYSISSFTCVKDVLNPKTNEAASQVAKFLIAQEKIRTEHYQSL